MGRILLVDDDPQFRRYVRRVLLRVGVEVSEAGDAWTALSLLAEQGPPDLICLDLMLPGLSGYELCERIRADPALRGVPIVAVSARTMPQDVALARTAGADLVLGKPVHMSRFSSSVLSMMEPPAPAH